mgnify:CR=1 FL=1
MISCANRAPTFSPKWMYQEPKLPFHLSRAQSSPWTALAAGDDRILFTDFVDGALRDELYSNAYLFVLPSDLEGMPLSLLEAMSYGNCVLVSDIEECTNVVHDRGITFRQGDVNDLEAKLRYAIEHPNAVRMFKWLSSDYICDRFQWDKVVDATLKLYQTT